MALSARSQLDRRPTCRRRPAIDVGWNLTAPSTGRTSCAVEVAVVDDASCGEAWRYSSADPPRRSGERSTLAVEAVARSARAAHHHRGADRPRRDRRSPHTARHAKAVPRSRSADHPRRPSRSAIRPLVAVEHRAGRAAIDGAAPCSPSSTMSSSRTAAHRRELASTLTTCRPALSSGAYDGPRRGRSRASGSGEPTRPRRPRRRAATRTPARCRRPTTVSARRSTPDQRSAGSRSRADVDVQREVVLGPELLRRSASAPLLGEIAEHERDAPSTRRSDGERVASPSPDAAPVHERRRCR